MNLDERVVKLKQSYNVWKELQKMRTRFKNRMSAIERGVSPSDPHYERYLIEGVFGVYNLHEKRANNGRTSLDVQVAPEIKAEKEFSVKQIMLNNGHAIGPIWDWLTSIKGLGDGSLAAQLLALVGNPARFATVSKLWRYAGYATFEYWVDESGKVKAPIHGHVWDKKQQKPVPIRPEQKEGWTLKRMRDVGVEGYCLPFNKPLKTLCFLISEQFVKQRTPVYREVYDDEKERQARINPQLTKGHIDRRGYRKTSKIFLQHLWLVWRESEGLEISQPYVHAVQGHTHIVKPPNWPM